MKVSSVFAAICLLKLIFCEELTTEKNQDPVIDRDEIAFVKIGTFRGFTDNESEYQKTYYISRYAKSGWTEAKSICNSFNLELVSFETLYEVNTFLKMCQEHEFVKSFEDEYFICDGMTETPYSPTDWYWTNTGYKISFSLPWQNGQPDFAGSWEYCLSFKIFDGFNDLNCEQHRAPFICQRLDFFARIRDN